MNHVHVSTARMKMSLLGRPPVVAPPNTASASPLLPRHVMLWFRRGRGLECIKVTTHDERSVRKTGSRR